MSTHFRRHTYQQIAVGLIFVYMTASIVWWYVELNHQALELHTHKMNSALRSSPPTQILTLQKDLEKNQLKFLSEGITFLIFIAIGWMSLSWIVFRQYQITAQQKRFLELLAHETKTPITITKLQLQNLQQQYSTSKKEPIPEIRMSLAQMDYLDMMVNKFLVLLRLENRNKLYPYFQKINVEEILKKCLAKMYEVFPHQENSVIIHSIPDEDFILGDEVLLFLLFSNIIENAWKHSKSTKPIEITLSHESSWFTIIIRDFGVGMNKQLEKKLFQKTIIQKPSIISRTGVGLQIANLVCYYHKGKISYERKDMGSAFLIKIPMI